MKKRTLGISLLLTGFALTLGAFLIPSSKAKEAEGYSASLALLEGIKKAPRVNAKPVRSKLIPRVLFFIGVSSFF